MLYWEIVYDQMHETLNSINLNRIIDRPINVYIYWSFKNLLINLFISSWVMIFNLRLIFYTIVKFFLKDRVEVKKSSVREDVDWSF
jgi:hypothetical protein